MSAKGQYMTLLDKCENWCFLPPPGGWSCLKFFMVLGPGKPVDAFGPGIPEPPAVCGLSGELGCIPEPAP